MNPPPSNPRSNRGPPTTADHLTDVVPFSGKSATAISAHRVRDTIKARSVVDAYVYMDSIFFAADVRCWLANPANREDERTKHEKKALRRQGQLRNRKLRPCVVIGVNTKTKEKPTYRLCPMAGFHKDGSRQLYEELREPASLLARPVETTYHNKTFGHYTAYQFTPEWEIGPQYLIPIEVSRGHLHVTNYWLPRKMHQKSYDRLLEDIEEASNVWKRWRNAEHVDVDCVDDIPVFKSKWDPLDWGKLSHTQWKAYPSGGNHRGRGAMRHRNYLALTKNIKFKQETSSDVPFEIPTDDSRLSNTSEESRASLADYDSSLVQDGNTPSQGHTSPYQADFPAQNLLYNSEEVPDSHPAVPSQLVPASSPRVKSLIEKGITPTEVNLQVPHSERSRHCEESIQGHKAAGIIGDAPSEQEGSSDMDISSTPNGRSSQLKNLAKRHSSRSSKTPDRRSPVRQDLVTPRVEVKPSHSSQHLSEDSVNTPHHDPIPVDGHILSEVAEVELGILEGEASGYPWRDYPRKKKQEGIMSRRAKRARSPEDELSAAGRPTKKREIG